MDTTDLVGVLRSRAQAQLAIQRNDPDIAKEISIGDWRDHALVQIAINLGDENLVRSSIAFPAWRYVALLKIASKAGDVGLIIETLRVIDDTRAYAMALIAIDSSNLDLANQIDHVIWRHYATSEIEIKRLLSSS